MKKSIRLLVAIVIFLLLMTVVMIHFTEQRAMAKTILQLEQIEASNRIVFTDAFRKELANYEGTEARQKIEGLIPLSTFDKKYHHMLQPALIDVYANVTFYEDDLFLGQYQIYTVDASLIPTDIQDRMLSVNGQPCLIMFNNRYWTLPMDMKNIQL
ncbi:MAG: hypothetical protein JXO44_08880 [Clostridia bacterium]|nr:hypothetical protein [Clostridia bacterium]